MLRWSVPERKRGVFRIAVTLLVFSVVALFFADPSFGAAPLKKAVLEETPLQSTKRGRALSTYIELTRSGDHTLQWGEESAQQGVHPRKRLNEIYGPLYGRLHLKQIAPLRTASSDCRGSPMANFFHALGYGRQSGVISISLSTSLMQYQSGSQSRASVPVLRNYPILILSKEGKNCSYEWVGDKALTPWVLTGTNGAYGANVEIEILHQVASGTDLSRARRLLHNARSVAELLSEDASDGLIADLNKIGRYKDLLHTIDDLVSASGQFRSLSSMKGKLLPFEAGTGDPWDKMILKVPQISLQRKSGED